MQHRYIDMITAKRSKNGDLQTGMFNHVESKQLNYLGEDVIA